MSLDGQIDKELRDQMIAYLQEQEEGEDTIIAQQYQWKRAHTVELIVAIENRYYGGLAQFKKDCEE